MEPFTSNWSVRQCTCQHAIRCYKIRIAHFVKAFALIVRNKSARTIRFTCRITSYNVCYTKLLRSLFFTVVTHAQQLPADEIIGAWEAEDGSVKLDMYKAGPEFEARLLYGNQVVES